MLISQTMSTALALKRKRSFTDPGTYVFVELLPCNVVKHKHACRQPQQCSVQPLYCNISICLQLGMVDMQLTLRLCGLEWLACTSPLAQTLQYAQYVTCQPLAGMSRPTACRHCPVRTADLIVWAAIPKMFALVMLSTPPPCLTYSIITSELKPQQGSSVQTFDSLGELIFARWQRL